MYNLSQCATAKVAKLSSLILSQKSLVTLSFIILMEDQVSHLKELGIKTANISSLEDHKRTRVENGQYSVVYGSPEAWLKNERWKSTLTNPVYSKKSVCHSS